MIKEELIKYKVIEKLIYEIKKEELQDFIIQEYFSHIFLLKNRLVNIPII